MSSETKKDSKGRNLKANEDQLKDGRYRYRYTDRYGNRKAIYAWKLIETDKTPPKKKNDKCLRQKERDLQLDIDVGLHTFDAKQLTVGALVEKYLKTKSIAESTINNYTDMLEKHIRPTNFGKLYVSDVRKSDVQAFYAYLRNTLHFAIGSIQLYQNLIYPSFQMAVEDDMIRKNPCKGCMRDYKSSADSSRVALSREEQRELLSFVQNSVVYNRYYPMIVFMLGTGCRIGETMGITWNDIDFDKAILHINHQVIYKKKKTEEHPKGQIVHYITAPKNKTSRDIPLQSDVLQILKEYKGKTYEISLNMGPTLGGYSNFVFLNSNLHLHTPNTLTRAFHNIVDAFNVEAELNGVDMRLPTFSAHTFRHTFCTRMAENKIDVKVLQTIMGHKTLAITMQVYNHVSNQRAIEEIKSLPSVLKV